MIHSYQGPRGNTLYYGGRAGAGPNRAGAVGGWAFDRGSDGTIDRARVGAAGVGPHGAAAGVAGFGPHGHGSAAIASNGQAARTWSRFVPN